MKSSMLCNIAAPIIKACSTARQLLTLKNPSANCHATPRRPTSNSKSRPDRGRIRACRCGAAPAPRRTALALKSARRCAGEAQRLRLRRTRALLFGAPMATRTFASRVLTRRLGSQHPDPSPARRGPKPPPAAAAAAAEAIAATVAKSSTITAAISTIAIPATVAESATVSTAAIAIAPAVPASSTPTTVSTVAEPTTTTFVPTRTATSPAITPVTWPRTVSSGTTTIRATSVTESIAETAPAAAASNTATAATATTPASRSRESPISFGSSCLLIALALLLFNFSLLLTLLFSGGVQTGTLLLTFAPFLFVLPLFVGLLSIGLLTLLTLFALFLLPLPHNSVLLLPLLFFVCLEGGRVLFLTPVTHYLFEFGSVLFHFDQLLFNNKIFFMLQLLALHCLLAFDFPADLVLFHLLLKQFNQMISFVLPPGAFQMVQFLNLELQTLLCLTLQFFFEIFLLLQELIFVDVHESIIIQVFDAFAFVVTL
mmetsp:Transcript_52608/g.109755  ORF Transcript_52608/g.109755 Transcript_52608/m.109755 type:complete len:486 (-) Transcript_52608:842-2299(-)